MGSRIDATGAANRATIAAACLALLILCGGTAAHAADSGVILAAAPASSPAPVHPPVFETREVFSDRIDFFPHWADMLGRTARDRKSPERPCVPPPERVCRPAEWTAFLETVKDAVPIDKMVRVNRELNRARYIEDIVNYGLPDYWATLREFLFNDGDCEDFAIAKYMSLRRLGFDADQLRVVVVQDLNLKVPHAVLIVFLDGYAYVLDNQADAVTPIQAIHHYRPFYSVNESGWWLHLAGN